MQAIRMQGLFPVFTCLESHWQPTVTNSPGMDMTRWPAAHELQICRPVYETSPQIPFDA